MESTEILRTVSLWRLLVSLTVRNLQKPEFSNVGKLLGVITETWDTIITSVLWRMHISKERILVPSDRSCVLEFYFHKSAFVAFAQRDVNQYVYSNNIVFF